MATQLDLTGQIHLVRQLLTEESARVEASAHLLAGLEGAALWSVAQERAQAVANLQGLTHELARTVQETRQRGGQVDPAALADVRSSAETLLNANQALQRRLSAAHAVLSAHLKHHALAQTGYGPHGQKRAVAPVGRLQPSRTV